VQYFQLVLGMSPFDAGLWMLPTMIAGIAGTLGAPYVIRFLSSGTAMTAGFVVAAPGLVLMAVATGRWPVVLGLSLAGLGIQLVLALTYDVVVSSAPPERAGVASGMGETGTELGIALGIAIAGSIVTAVYRAGVSVPVGAPDSVRDTLGNAVAEAGQLPAPLGQQLLTSAREAYTYGVQLAAAVSVVMVVILAATTAKLVQTK
jgi:DHA2 family multidrug resistance protein-like MFS transporter